MGLCASGLDGGETSRRHPPSNTLSSARSALDDSGPKATLGTASERELLTAAAAGDTARVRQSWPQFVVPHAEHTSGLHPRRRAVAGGQHHVPTLSCVTSWPAWHVPQVKTLLDSGVDVNFGATLPNTPTALCEHAEAAQPAARAWQPWLRQSDAGSCSSCRWPDPGTSPPCPCRRLPQWRPRSTSTRPS